MQGELEGKLGVGCWREKERGEREKEWAANTVGELRKNVLPVL